MNITKDHILFYASKKHKIFKQYVNIHSLINSQNIVKLNSNKLNDVTQLNMVYKRCLRNNLKFSHELLIVTQNMSNKSRLNYFMKIRSKLIKRGY